MNKEPIVLKHASLTILAVIFFTTTLQARTVPHWTSESLSNEADVVVIGVPTGFTDWNGDSDESRLGNGRLTIFYVKHVAKGSVASRQLELVHYRSVAARRNLGPGPGLRSHSTFRPRLADFDRPDPDLDTDPDNPTRYDFRLYLKRRTDGRYEPVSGQIDSVYSAVLLYPQDEAVAYPRNPLRPYPLNTVPERPSRAGP